MSEVRDLWKAGATLALGHDPSRQERTRFKSAFFEVLREYMKDPNTRQSLIGDLAAFADDSRRDTRDNIRYAVYIDIGALPPNEGMAYVEKVRQKLRLKDAVYMPSRDGNGSRIEKFDEDWNSPQERAWELFKNAIPMDWESRTDPYAEEPIPDLKHTKAEEFDEIMNWAIARARQWDDKMSPFVGNSLEKKPEEER